MVLLSGQLSWLDNILFGSGWEWRSSKDLETSHFVDLQVLSGRSGVCAHVVDGGRTRDFWFEQEVPVMFERHTCKRLECDGFHLKPYTQPTLAIHNVEHVYQRAVNYVSWHHLCLFVRVVAHAQASALVFMTRAFEYGPTQLVWDCLCARERWSWATSKPTLMWFDCSQDTI